MQVNGYEGRLGYLFLPSFNLGIKFGFSQHFLYFVSRYVCFMSDLGGFEDRKALLVLLRVALTGKQESVPDSVDWQAVLSMAVAQGVAGVAFEGFSLVFHSLRSVPFDLKMRWIGQVNRMEQAYEHQWLVAKRLSELWATEGIESVVLKGRVIAQYYSYPAHRYSCDLDLFISDIDWERACQLLENKGVTLVREVYKEVEFSIRGVYVECHRCITPYRGNDVLKHFELYLRNLLAIGNKTYFTGTSLVCPPFMFTVMLYIEHALGDLLHGKLSLKHIVDWFVLRQKMSDSEYKAVETECMEFGFERFLKLVNAFYDVVINGCDESMMPQEYKEVFESLFRMPSSDAKIASCWFARRVQLFFDILQNRKMYRSFGYCSMENFLFNSIWTHFFDKRLDLPR